MCRWIYHTHPASPALSQVSFFLWMILILIIFHASCYTMFSFLHQLLNLHSSIYILSNDTSQFNILLDITFPIFRNCVPLDISAFSLSIQSLSCAAKLEGYWQASLDFRENNHTQEECDQKNLPDSAKFYNIMVFPMFLLAKKSFQLQKLFLVKLKNKAFLKKQILFLVTTLWWFHHQKFSIITHNIILLPPTP